ncbi:MAG: phage terminase large subunit family protein [Caulobacteraceae bacterium]
MSTSSSPSSESLRPTSPPDASPAARLTRAFWRGYTPPPRISVPEWADRYRKLAKEAGSTSGAWRTSTVEIARGPMLAATEPGVHTITAMVATQLLKTSLLENVFGYFAHLDPCPMLLVQPKDEAAEAFSKERIAPLIKATPVLRQLVGSSKSRSSSETLLYKSFPGGFLALTGAGSPDNLARRPVRLVLYDETDKYPVTKEGDPLVLGDERMATFVNWLSLRACSPTDPDGRIARSYAAGDQRKASVECPHCRHRQFLDFFKHVDWPKEDGQHLTAQAQIFCESCRKAWSEGQKQRALKTIRYHQTRPFRCCGEYHDPLASYEEAWQAGDDHALDSTWCWWASDRFAVYRATCRRCGAWGVSNEHASFQASKLYSPWPKDTPAAIAAKWIAAQGDEDALQAWWNTQMAQVYRRNLGREIKADALAARGEVWAAEVPDGVAIVTVGIDVQDYRLEAEAVGWGRNEESWSLEHAVFEGDPENDPGVWEQLDNWLKKVRHRADGRGFEVAAACIDSGGHHTQKVYEYAKARLGRRIWAIKGESARNGQRNPVWPVKRPSSKTKKAFRPVILGVNAAKDVIFARLLKERPGAGYMHFPADRDVGYFQQLTAERSVTKFASGGVKYRVWEQIAGRANEALDCRVYAYAALCGLSHMGLLLNRRADVVGAAVSPTPAPDAPAEITAQEAPAAVPVDRPRDPAAAPPGTTPGKPPSAPPPSKPPSSPAKRSRVHRMA